MKTSLRILLLAGLLAVAIRSSAYPVYTPPGNIVQNGNFHDYFNHWGNLQVVLGNWPTVPNDYGAIANDPFQDLATVPGQQYALAFYAAADVSLAPSVTVNIALNQAISFSFTTPPYAYDPTVGRFDQMHWQQVTGIFTASSTTTRLEFIDINTDEFGLAAVSVVAVPEPATMTLISIVGLGVLVGRKRRLPNNS